jgi:hypothetical protein
MPRYPALAPGLGILRDAKKTRKTRDGLHRRTLVPSLDRGDDLGCLGPTGPSVPRIRRRLSLGTKGRTGPWLSRRSWPTVGGKSATATRKVGRAARSATQRPKRGGLDPDGCSPPVMCARSGAMADRPILLWG